MRLLDTQAFVVLGDETQGGIGALGKKARATLEDPANKLLLVGGDREFKQYKEAGRMARADDTISPPEY